MSVDSPSVLIVDDDDCLLRALSRLLQVEGYAVETYSTPGGFINRPALDSPGCLLLDLNMPGMTGLDVQELANRRGDDLPVIFLSGHGHIPDSVRAMKQGALDFLVKPVSADQLLGTVSKAVQIHEAVLCEKRIHRELESKFNTLTARETQVAILVAQGFLNKQIAGDLGISEKTVKIHRARVMTKLAVRSVAELVRLLGKLGVDVQSFETLA